METDSACAVKLIDNWYIASMSAANLIRETKTLLNNFDQVPLKQVFREVNSVVDSFAKNGLDLLLPFRIYDYCPFYSVPLRFDYMRV